MAIPDESARPPTACPRGAEAAALRRLSAQSRELMNRGSEVEV